MIKIFKLFFIFIFCLPHIAYESDSLPLLPVNNHQSVVPEANQPINQKTLYEKINDNKLRVASGSLAAICAFGSLTSIPINFFPDKIGDRFDNELVIMVPTAILSCLLTYYFFEPIFSNTDQTATSSPTD